MTQQLLAGLLFGFGVTMILMGITMLFNDIRKN
jgi:hypothetical protein